MSGNVVSAQSAGVLTGWGETGSFGDVPASLHGVPVASISIGAG